jgi:hypothetical protein
VDLVAGCGTQCTSFGAVLICNANAVVIGNTECGMRRDDAKGEPVYFEEWLLSSSVLGDERTVCSLPFSICGRVTQCVLPYVSWFCTKQELRIFHPKTEPYLTFAKQPGFFDDVGVQNALTYVIKNQLPYRHSWRYFGDWLLPVDRRRSTVDQNRKLVCTIFDLFIACSCAFNCSKFFLMQKKFSFYGDDHIYYYMFDKKMGRTSLEDKYASARKNQQPQEPKPPKRKIGNEKHVVVDLSTIFARCLLTQCDSFSKYYNSISEKEERYAWST